MNVLSDHSTTCTPLLVCSTGTRKIPAQLQCQTSWRPMANWRFIFSILAAAFRVAEPYTLRLGWNCGYLSDSSFAKSSSINDKHAAKVFRRIAVDGITHLRFMGPFLHKQGSAADRRENWTTALLQNVSAVVGPNATITLSLSDFPFDVVDDLLVHPGNYLVVWPGQPSVTDLVDTLRYTNRAPPTRGAWAGNATMADYSTVLRRLRALVAPNVDFEIANEPNALSYFWGDADDFSPVAKATFSALSERSLPPPPRVTCCAFATELGCQNLPPNVDNGFAKLARGGAIAMEQKLAAAGRFPTALSWHFYRRVSNDASTARSTYANATAFYGRDALNGSVISEWGLATFNSPQSAARINSPELMLELVRLLAFAFDAGVAAVHAHCLMDHPHKRGHDCYFDRFGQPRLAYTYYELVARTIRGGYTVSGGGALLTNVTGVSSGLRILAAAGDPDGRHAQDAAFAMAPDRGVVAASSALGFATGKKNILRAGEWIVTQAEPVLKYGQSMRSDGE